MRSSPRSYNLVDGSSLDLRNTEFFDFKKKLYNDEECCYRYANFLLD